MNLPAWSKGLARVVRKVARVSARRPRSLQLRETLQLGEHRLVAVVAFREQQFLIGASGSSMSLLTRLPARDEGERDGSLTRQQDGGTQ